MGWETFHQTSKQDKNLPIVDSLHGPLCPLGMGRIGAAAWEAQYGVPGQGAEGNPRLGPEVGVPGHVLLDRPAMPPYHPKWLKEIGGKELDGRLRGQGPFPIPDMDDPVVLKAHLDFIKRLGEKYDGHPDIDHIDLGSIGWWGEWHLSGSKKCKLPTLGKPHEGGRCLPCRLQEDAAPDAHWRRRLPEICLRPRHGLAGRLPGRHGRVFTNLVPHAARPTLSGSRKPGSTTPGRRPPLPGKRAGTCGSGSRRAGRCATSSIMPWPATLRSSTTSRPRCRKGENVRPEIERFLRRLGYRLVLKELKHPAQVQAGGKLELVDEMAERRLGPLLQAVSSGLSLEQRQRLQQGDRRQRSTVNRWLPGSIDLFTPEFFKMPKDLPPGEINDVSDTITLPADLPAGPYTLSIAIVDASSTPVVRLGIKGRADDGWYPLSKIQVMKVSELPVSPFPILEMRQHPSPRTRGICRNDLSWKRHDWAIPSNVR